MFAHADHKYDMQDIGHTKSMVEKIVGNALKQLRPEFDKANYDRVIELCNKILTYQSQHPLAFFFRASSYLRKEEYNNSEDDFQSLLSLPSLDKNLHLNALRGLATLYEESDNFDKHLETMLTIFDYRIK